MWGRQVNDSRRVGLLMALGGLGVLVAASLVMLLTHRWLGTDPSPTQSSESFSTSAQKTPAPITALPTTAASPAPTISPQAEPTDPTGSASTSSVSIASGGSSSRSLTSASEGSATAVRQGVLRISNPTGYPVRVALLAQKSQSAAIEAAVSYDLPAHWDFAPQEGGAKGLIVSLPNRNLKVTQGDILVAFAQDGSRRYWGPYVVGETTLPRWNSKSAEWELVLQP